MHSIGTIAGAPTGLGNLTSQLPWGWFAVMGVIDVALVVVVIRRRRAARVGVGTRPQATAHPAETLVLRNGWSVPRWRALGVRPHPLTYVWPLHSEYMVSRLA